MSPEPDCQEVKQNEVGCLTVVRDRYQLIERFDLLTEEAKWCERLAKGMADKRMPVEYDGSSNLHLPIQILLQIFPFMS